MVNYRKWYAPAAIASIILLINIESTIANLSIYALTDAFHIGLHNLQWIISAYMLSFSSSLILSGNLTDKYGAQRVLECGLVLFILSSTVAGLSFSFLMLAITRLFQGFAGSLMFSAAMTLLFQSFSLKNKMIAQTYSGIAMALGITFAPLLGGFILHHEGWRSVFFINIPLAFLAGLACRFALGKSTYQNNHRKIPYLNAALLALALLMCARVIVHMNTQMQISLPDISLIAVTIFLLAAYLILEIRSPNPLIEIKLLRKSNYLLPSIIRFLIQGILFFYYFAIAVLGKKAFHLSPIQTSLTFVLPGLALGVAYFTAKYFTSGDGYIIQLRVFCLLLLAGCSALIFKGIGDRLWGIILVNSVLLYGAGAINSFLSTHILIQSDPQKIGAATGMINTFAFIGASFSVVIASVIMFDLTNHEITHWILQNNWQLHPSALQAMKHLVFEGNFQWQDHDLLNAAGMSALQQQMAGALLVGYRYAMLFFVVLSFIATVISFILRENPNRYHLSYSDR